MTAVRVSTLILLAIGLWFGPAAARAQSFTYQGRLADGGVPAEGQYSLQFRLMDAAAGGSQVGPTLTLAGTPVVDGLFTVSLNFGAGVFSAAGGRWLEIGVAPAGEASFTVLAPRQRIDAVPRALALEWPSAGSAATGVPMLALTNSSSGTVIDAVNAGTGLAVRAQVTNPTSGSNALVATNSGSGSALHAQANGSGRAAVIRNSNSSNTQTVLDVTTNGNGTAAEFAVTNLNGDKPAVIVRNDGAGPGLVCESSGAAAPALKVNGPLGLVGDGALITVTGAAGDTGFIRLDHPLLNNNPTAHLFVQPRTHASFNQARQVYPWYSAGEARWRLKAYEGGINLEGFPFDVLIIQKFAQ